MACGVKQVDYFDHRSVVLMSSCSERQLRYVADQKQNNQRGPLYECNVTLGIKD